MQVMKESAKLKIEIIGNSLVVQCLELWPSTAEGMGSIPGQGTKILDASQKRKKKKIKLIEIV